MDVPNIAGLVLVAGVIVFFAAVAPGPNVYGIQDTTARLAKLHEHEGAFRLAQAMFSLGAVLVAVGFVILAIWLGDRMDPLIPATGAVAAAVGAVLWTAYMIARATDPETHFGDYGRAPAYAWASFISTALGMAAFGLVFLDIDGSQWVGILTLVVAAGAVAFAVLAPQIAPPQLLYLPPLVIGGVLLTSGWPALASLGRNIVHGL